MYSVCVDETSECFRSIYIQAWLMSERKNCENKYSNVHIPYILKANGTIQCQCQWELLRTQGTSRCINANTFAYFSFQFVFTDWFCFEICILIGKVWCISFGIKMHINKIKKTFKFSSFTMLIFSILSNVFSL